MLDTARARLLDIEQCSARLEARFRCSRVLDEQLNSVIFAQFAVFSSFVISKYSQNYPFWLDLVKKYFQIGIFTKIKVQVQLLCWKNMLKSEFYRCFGARIDARCSKKFSDRFSSMLELGSMLERRWESSLHF